MATWTATNVLTGAVEKTKYVQIGVVTEIYSVALTTALALNDIITGPNIPAGCFLDNVKIDVGQLDSNGSPLITLDVGISGTAQKFLAASTVAQAGGIAGAAVAGTVGYSPTTDTAVLVKVHAAAATAKAGTIVISVTYTASP